ncbi:transporter substrate-binding domain-containing protein [Bosea eneae]|uniref:Transporter substrate-binding domain-containing protein n=1 Tax=Bosea eneae TaxID=151454 RepID=A0ABW0IZB9_9HYPH
MKLRSIASLIVSALLTGAALAPINSAQAQSTSTLEEVKVRGVLRAGVRQDVLGFGIVDEKGKIVGFDVDLVGELAKRLKVRLELVPVTATTRIPLLQQGRVDLIAATLTYYRQRDDVIDFSIGYFAAGQRLMVKKTSPIRTISDTAKKRVGTTIGAGVVENLKKAQPEATVQTFEGYPEAFLAMQRGLVDAIVADAIILAGLRANTANPEDYVIIGTSLNRSNYSIGVRENDSKWRDAVNYTLQDIWRDGTWDQIYDRWIGSGSKIKLSKDEIGFAMDLWE